MVARKAGIAAFGVVLILIQVWNTFAGRRPTSDRTFAITALIFYTFLASTAFLLEKQPRLLVIWGKYDLSFDLGEPERYRKDVPKAEVHVLNAGHFALDTAADEIVELIRGFMK